MNELFTGSATAVVTPFKDDGKIDYDLFYELIKLQKASGMSAVIVAGTTGEGSTLSNAEKCELVKIAKSLENIQVIAGCGSNNTASAKTAAELITACGADGLLVVTPYYNKTSQEGLFEHYKEISDATNLPVIVYNVPSRTGMSISIDTYQRLCEIDNIMGIKEASGNIPLITGVMSLCGNRLKYYCGNDDIMLPFLSLGGDGVISVVGNILPKEVTKLCAAYFKGNISLAASIQLKLYKIISAMSAEVNPIPVKAALEILGLGPAKYRLPLTKAHTKTLKIIRSELEKLSL